MTQRKTSVRRLPSGSYVVGHNALARSDSPAPPPDTVTAEPTGHQRRDAAYQAVYEVIGNEPSSVQENARVWRAVCAALDAAGVPPG